VKELNSRGPSFTAYPPPNIGSSALAYSMFLHNHRAGHGARDAALGFPSPALQGDRYEAGLDEGPALRPFAADIAALVEGRAAPDPAGADPGQVLRRAEDLEQLGRRLDAVLVLRQAVASAPGNEELLFRLVRLLEASGEGEEALEALDAGLQPARAAPRVRTRRGAVLCRMGRHAEAEADLRAALAAMPRDAEARLYLGLSLLRRGRHGEAIEELRQATALAPENGEAAFHLGEAWYHSGRFDQALVTLRQATELAPSDPRAYKLLGRLLDRMGRTEEAMAMHRKAREAGA